MFHIDLLDKKILNILIGHGRIEYSEIARLTGTSTERVLYRIRRLFKTGIINDYKTLLDYRTLGYTQYNLFIKLKHISYEIREKWQEYFKTHPFAIWVGICVGEYDYRVFVIAKDDLHLREILAKIDTDLGANIGSIMVLHRTRKYEGENYMTFRKYSTEKEIKEIQQTLSRIKIEEKEKPITILDSKDMKIIEWICKRPRMKYTEIAKEMNLTPEDIKYHMKKINSTNIINRYSISIDYSKLGLLWLSILVKITHKHQEKELVDHVMSYPQTINVIENLGDWDLEITFCARSIEEADNYILEFREKHIHLITDYQFFITKNGLKYPQVAEGIFEQLIKQRSAETTIKREITRNKSIK